MAEVLDQDGIPYQREWNPPGLGRKRCDFALVEHKILIEFDGPHHREPVVWSSTISEDVAAARLAQVRASDAAKTAWAAKNGWRLIRLTDADTVEEDLRADADFAEASLASRSSIGFDN